MEHQSISDESLEVYVGIATAEQFIKSLSEEVDRNIEMIENLERYIDSKVNHNRYYM